MSLLITSSLIDSVEWLEKAPPSWQEKAFRDLRKSLAREPWGETSPDVERGMVFERTVYDTLDKKADQNPTFKCSDEFRVFLDACRGGVFQKKIKRIEVIDGKEYCLYGKTDVFFPDHIIDIKACAEYGGESKYLGKAQHLLYCYVTEVDYFDYLVAEFGPTGREDSMKIKRHFLAHYDVGDRNELRETVVKRIRKAVGFIEQDSELYKLYTTTFSRY
jgi:hypothetical protein